MCIEMGREKRRRGELAWWVTPGDINQEGGGGGEDEILPLPLLLLHGWAVNIRRKFLWQNYDRQK